MATAMTITVGVASASIPISGGGTRTISWDSAKGNIPLAYGMDEIVSTCFQEWLRNSNSGSVDYTVSVSS